jgi:hypothetical protein
VVNEGQGSTLFGEGPCFKEGTLIEEIIFRCKCLITCPGYLCLSVYLAVFSDNVSEEFWIEVLYGEKQ